MRQFQPQPVTTECKDLTNLFDIDTLGSTSEACLFLSEFIAAVWCTVAEIPVGPGLGLCLVRLPPKLVDSSRIKSRLFSLKVTNVRIHLKVRMPLTMQGGSSHSL